MNFHLYQTPAIKNPKVKRLMEKFDAPTIVRYCMESSNDDRKVYFNLFIVRAKDGQKIVFASNYSY